jgi:hypothetical protein
MSAESSHNIPAIQVHGACHGKCFDFNMAVLRFRHLTLADAEPSDPCHVRSWETVDFVRKEMGMSIARSAIES